MKSKADFEEKILIDISQKGFSYFDTESIVDGYGDSLDIIDELNTGTYKISGKAYTVRCEHISENNNRVPFGYSFSYFIYGNDDCEPIRIKDVVFFLKYVLQGEYGTTKRYFRGQLAHYDIIPSLFRERQYVLDEMEINATIFNDRPDDFRTCNSTFEKLVKLRHFDAPSRLLDLTSNPLIALFFACYSGSKNNDRGVGVVLEAFCAKDDEKMSVSSDTVVMLTAMTNTRIKKMGSSQSGKYPISCYGKSYASDNGESTIVPKQTGSKCCCNSCVTWKKNRTLKRDRRFGRLSAKWEWDYVRELSHQCKKEGMPIYWDYMCFPELNQCILVHPPLNNQRIVQQKGCFIMCGMNPRDIFSPPDSLYGFFSNPTGKRYIYYVLPEDKESILNQLEILGIDEYFIFPEFDRDIKVVSERKKQCK